METGTISQKEAGHRIDVTPRQVRRMMKRIKAEGVSGLISKKRVPLESQAHEETVIEAMDLSADYHDSAPPWQPKLREGTS